MTKLRIADDPAFAKEPFVAAAGVQVVVGILPAFRGNIEVRKVLLAEPSLVVIQRDNGFNFDSIGAKGKGGAAPTPADQAPADPEAAEGASTAAFLIAHTEIRDASLRYVDMRSKPAMELLVQDFDFEASDVSLTSSITLATAAALFGASDQNVKLSGTIGPVGSPVDTERIPIDLDVRIGPFVIDELKKLALFADAIPPDLESPDPIGLALNVSGTPAKVRLTGGFDARSTGIRFGDTFRKPRGTPLALEIDATYAGDSVDLAKLVFRLAGLEVAGKGRMETGAGAAYDLKIDSNPAPLAGWNELVPALEGYDVSGQLEVHMHARRTADGEPRLEGTIGLQNVSALLKDSPHEIEGLTSTVKIAG